MANTFLKWAGSKRASIDLLNRKLPKGDRLVEPFVGGGSVFMGTDYPAYLLADSNPDLINLFRVLQEDGEDFIDYAETSFTSSSNNEARYYEWRDLFNDTREDVILKAGLFLYLNRHGYSGLCRYNADGGFNVPFGRYKQVYFPRGEMLAFHQKANERDVTFVCQDFGATFLQIRGGDVVYCDPPFVPSQEGGFTAYSGKAFGWDDHVHLAGLAEIASDNGIPVAISNHANQEVNRIYRKKGAALHFASVGRAINCNASRRNPVKEVLAIWPGMAIEKAAV